MYCGQCGKRVLEDMLFCPFCGSPIVIPEQDEPARAKAVDDFAAAPSAAKEPAPATERSPEPEQVSEPEQAPEEEQATEPEEASEPEQESEDERVPESLAAPEPEGANALQTEARAEDAPSEAPRMPRPGEAVSGPARKPVPPVARPVSLFDDLDDLDDPDDSDDAGDAGAPEASDGFAEADAPDAEDLSDEADPYDAEDLSDEADLFDETDLSDEDDLFAVEEPPEEEDEPFSPLEIGAVVDAGDEELPPPRREPPRRAAPRRPAPAGGGRRASKTFIPVRDVNPDDMFMGHIRPSLDEYDSYDGEDVDAGPAKRGREDALSFEDAEPESFVQRHARGVVGLILLALLLVIFLVWAMLPAGQRVLASANLAWNAQVYNELGNEDYEAGQYRRAARNFERAFARDSDNYDYAHSAMVAYYEAGDQDSSLAMLKHCIDMAPDDPDPYIELTILYPDPSERPWEVQQLLRQGYERTGEAALNDIGDRDDRDDSDA